MLLTSDANGVYPIAPMPLFDDGSIDTSSIDRLVDPCRACGCKGITVLSPLGKAPKLGHSESVDIAVQVVRRAGTLPVAVGVLAPGFAAMRALARNAMDCGAVGVTIAPSNTPGTDDRIASYHRQAAEAIGSDIDGTAQARSAADGLHADGGRSSAGATGTPRSQGLAAGGLTRRLSSNDGRRPFLQVGLRPRSKP